MDWDQIESKWAAMARRVCADLPSGTADAAPLKRGRASKSGAQPIIVADQQANLMPAENNVMSNE